MKTALLGLAAAGLFLVGAAATSAPVDCATPVLRSVSPDTRHRLEICRGRLFFAMPGQSGDAPGMAVLRDADGQIEGVVALAMLNAVEGPPRWEADAVALPLVARIAYTSGGATVLGDAFWRLRTWLRAVPRDEEFR
ncbi:hypothetical protein [Plastoroseomonas hellenica]|uniref:hypothetical protein n=1 Tax=Plastoroseomonas hellenica TaxID=2687306 RepID=UPI001BA44923|nr:hypothetical protein [Plastoroseomonas hellenica]MBR0643688.1 hypothetical protein [Plastoroseomonas hellenica]